MKPDLSAELIALFGEEIVLLDQESIQAHSVDWWPIAIKEKQQGRLPWKPDVVVRPNEIEQVGQVLSWANRHKVAVTPWGLGSGVTGAALAVHGGISLDLSALNRLISLDEESLIVRVQAGMNGLELERALNLRGYTLNHSPQSLDRSSVGGWVATKAIGQFSTRWGGIEDLVLGVKVALPSGELVETPLGPRAATGPNLVQLFIGSEGTLGVIVEIVLRIFPIADYRCYEAAIFPDVSTGLRAMRQTLRHGLRPFLLRFYDVDETRRLMKDPEYMHCLMLLGFEGLENVARAEYSSTIEICRLEGGQPIGQGPVLDWMERRFDFTTVENYQNQSGGYAETIEVADFWGGILETYQSLKIGLRPFSEAVLGHFSHSYTQGTSLYLILLGRAINDSAAQAQLSSIWEAAMRICLERGAVISHHHGIGLARGVYLQQALGSSGFLLEKIKRALDPHAIMNPGKLNVSSIPPLISLKE